MSAAGWETAETLCDGTPIRVTVSRYGGPSVSWDTTWGEFASDNAEMGTSVGPAGDDDDLKRIANVLRAGDRWFEGGGAAPFTIVEVAR